MRYSLLLLTLAAACIALAVILPLASLRTDNEASRPPVITMPGEDPGTGLFPAPWTTRWPGLATLVGVVLPIGLLSIATFILVRQPCSDAQADALDAVPD